MIYCPFQIASACTCWALLVCSSAIGRFLCGRQPASGARRLLQDSFLLGRTCSHGHVSLCSNSYCSVLCLACTADYAAAISFVFEPSRYCSCSPIVAVIFVMERLNPSNHISPHRWFGSTGRVSWPRAPALGTHQAAQISVGRSHRRGRYTVALIHI